DILSVTERSARMRLIRSGNTAPELLVRKLVHSLGYRYRLHAPDLPGKPDLVFAGRRKVIFVHGCFWHTHHGCNMGRPPKSNLDFWLSKLRRNRERDERVLQELRNVGYRVFASWQCVVERGSHRLEERMRRFLG